MLRVNNEESVRLQKKKSNLSKKALNRSNQARDACLNPYNARYSLQT